MGGGGEREREERKGREGKETKQVGEKKTTKIEIFI